MKKALAIVIALNTGCAAETAPGTTSAPSPVPSAPQNVTQPYQDITQFYRDWSYAASFSTPAERSRLRLVVDPDEAEGLSQRLKTVIRRLKNIESGIQKIDIGGPGRGEFGNFKIPPRICAERQNKPEFPSACESLKNEAEPLRLAPPGYPVAAELADLVDVQKKGSTIAVRVKFWPLLPPDNALLVASYEKWQGKTPDPDVQQLKSLFQSGPRTEIHTWTLVGGRWMRNEANLVLLQK